MTIFIRLSLFTIVTIFARLGTTEAIVPECTFTGTSGFCAGMVGRFIRPEYNPNIRALYIVNCDLTALTSDDFARFQSLSTLHINNSTLPLTTYQHLLSDLKELKDLQITHSNIADNIKYMFANNTGLNNLSLQGNKITQIRKDTFSHLTQLETIDVSNNDISEVDQDSFVNLKHLKKLVLSKNKIEDNEKADNLWQAFEEKYDILFLEDNPICSTLGTDARSQEATDTDAAAGQPGAGCDLVRRDECQKHEARRVFFTTACTQSGAARRRSGRNHGDDLSSAPEVEDGGDTGHVPDSAPEVEDGGDAGHVPDSAPEVEDGGDAGDLPDSAPQEEDQHDPPAAGASGEAEAEGADGEHESAVEQEPSSPGGGARDAASDNVDDNDYDGAAGDDVAADDAPADGEPDDLPLSSVEVEEVQVDRLSQFSSRSVLLGAIGGVVAGIGVGTALVVFFRTKTSYRSIQQNEEHPDKIELKVIKNHELPAFAREEATPLTRIPTQ